MSEGGRKYWAANAHEWGGSEWTAWWCVVFADRTQFLISSIDLFRLAGWFDRCGSLAFVQDCAPVAKNQTRWWGRESLPAMKRSSIQRCRVYERPVEAHVCLPFRLAREGGLFGGLGAYVAEPEEPKYVKARFRVVGKHQT